MTKPNRICWAFIILFVFSVISFFVAEESYVVVQIKECNGIFGRDLAAQKLPKGLVLSGAVDNNNDFSSGQNGLHAHGKCHGGNQIGALKECNM